MSVTGLFIIGVLVTLIVAGAMALLVYAAILDGRDAAARAATDREPAPHPRAGSILQAARAAGSFETLIAAFDRAGLSDVLEHQGPYTVFAPTDAAFAKLPRATVTALEHNRTKLRAVLLYHVLQGRITAAKLVKLHSVKTLNGQSLKVRVKNGVVTVGGVRVIKTNIAASNGVIHVIDGVLIPR